MASTKIYGMEHKPRASAPPRYQEQPFEFDYRGDLLESMSTIDG